MSAWKAWRDVPAAERLKREQALEPLSENGFVVTSRELSRDGPWRIEIFGEGDRRPVEALIDRHWRWEALPEIDWVAENQRSFTPFAVGPFWIHPSHAAGGAPAGLLPIEIDAGLAFGTGTHATTRGCLEMLATLDPAETVNAVDVGCGSGILAIAMARLWKRPVLAGDNDPDAVVVARENAARNGIGPLCRFHHAAGLDAPALADARPYDLIVANILAGPLIELSDAFAASLRPGGRALLSGLLAEQAASVVDAYARRGLILVRHLDLATNDTTWRTLLLRKA
ncbi:50S ribosomal protein L11 methyltransferase [Enhydrobacter sp.]|uniref:50S ribosomal protein L11 methyltransferase n=1 Tax=Enhydrobacter sp. TaxID=1894999 RepID=UPI00262CB8D7|nr:50S ribosomal protein L11 methyltransferase [Enhydrobacter sp.]WIM09392.1 MAG: Ribosomal protein L11 methyltransferase [Enhydrobacter sp.]